MSKEPLDMVFGRSSEAEWKKVDRKMTRAAWTFFFIKNMSHGEEKLFYEKNRFVSQKNLFI